MIMRSAFVSGGACALVLALAAQPVAALGGQPDPSNLVPDTVAAGAGQLLTIQGFDLFVAGSTTVTLTAVGTGATNHCVFVFDAASSATELYVRLGVFESPNPAGCSAPIPSVVPPGKYKLTVTTPAGTSPPILLKVKSKPGTPVPRRLLECPETAPCTPTSFFLPGARVGILAYGTDTVGAEAVFIQGDRVIPVTSDVALIGGGQPDPGERGVINTFVVPTGLTPGPALLRLRTSLTAIGGGGPDPSNSPLSFALVLEIEASPSPPPSDL